LKLTFCALNKYICRGAVKEHLILSCFTG